MRIRRLSINNPMKIVDPTKVVKLSGQGYFEAFALEYLKNKHNLCQAEGLIFDNGISNMMWESSESKMHLESCMSSSTRFIILTLTLIDSGGNSDGHANIIILDNEQKTAERFEPHGAMAVHSMNFEQPLVDDFLTVLFEHQYGYTYHSPLNFCPYYGIQSFESSEVSGYCATWSIYYVDMRLTYPNIARTDLVNRLVAKIQELQKLGQLDRYILSYADTIYQVIRDNFGGISDDCILQLLYMDDKEKLKFTGLSHLRKRATFNPVSVLTGSPMDMTGGKLKRKSKSKSKKKKTSRKRSKSKRKH
jgi:hypothetical protein